MKFKLLRDILIYIIIPVLLFNVAIINNQQIAFQISCSLAIVYSIFTKIKENRVNTTGLFLCFIIVAYFLLNINPNMNNKYFYNTCIFLFVALLIPMLKVLNKDISIIVIKDILKSLDKNTLAMIRLLKKKSMLYEINKISYMIETNLIFISLLRIVNILIYGQNVTSRINIISNCVGIVFTAIIIYKIIKVIYICKKLKINKSNNNLKKENDSKGKVINLNYYK